MRRTAALTGSTFGLLLGLLVAMPTAAATTGTICGELTGLHGADGRERRQPDDGWHHRGH